MSVVIFSREIHSGKTTELFKWINSEKNVAGILMPDQQGRRMFYDIAQGVYFPAQADAHSLNKLTAGSYLFDADAFEKASEAIKNASVDRRSLIIIDEVGKLEMEDKGFSKVLRHLIEKNRDLLIVVRDSLVHPVSDKFGLSGSRIISSMKDY